MKTTTIRSKYFMGNEVSAYGQQNGYVDYATLSKAFDAVLSNDIITKTSEIGYWNIENGDYTYYEDSNGNTYTEAERDKYIDELEDEILDIDEEKNADRIAEIEADIEALDCTYDNEIYQYYIISDNGADILKRFTDEIVFYNEELDMYVWWGVTHCGTSWDYVLTDIKIEAEAA